MAVADSQQSTPIVVTYQGSVEGQLPRLFEADQDNSYHIRTKAGPDADFRIEGDLQGLESLDIGGCADWGRKWLRTDSGVRPCRAKWTTPAS